MRSHVMSPPDHHRSPSAPFTLETLDFVDHWTRTRLTQLNRDILAGRAAPARLIRELNDQVLAVLPPPNAAEGDLARRLLVHLGLCGASVARHLQERDSELRANPTKCFAELRVTTGQPFLDYFRDLASSGGLGHPPRDAYASLVRWNTPPVQVNWAGDQVATLPSAFTDGLIRTYTGDRGEQAFLGLLKECEAAEHAANKLIQPIADGEIGPASTEAIDRIRVANALLAVARRLLLDFVSTTEPPLGVDHFVEVFRQFALHWRSGDIPPSGAQDAEFLKRDLLLGIDIPGYPERIRRIFPGLLMEEQDMLTARMDRPSLPVLLLRSLRLHEAELSTATPAQLCWLAAVHPCLVEYFLLLRTNARLSASHLMVTKKMLFRPTRAREHARRSGNVVVPNFTGTTEMIEQELMALARARHRHVLRAFAAVPVRTLLNASGRPPEIAVSSETAADTIRRGH